MNIRFFNVLEKKDIEEKIELNIKNGITLPQFKELLLEEKYQLQRDILRAKDIILNANDSILRNEIQIQNIEEQLSVIDNKLKAEA